MIKNLPNWYVADDQPAFYDTESATAIEMVAKLYAKIQELIPYFNENYSEITKIVEEFKSLIDDNFNAFAVELRQEFQDFIDIIELKIKGNNINVIIKSKEHSNTIANNIMRTIQSNYEDSKYITIKFRRV